MNTKISKYAAIALLLAVSFYSCYQQEEKKEKLPCDPDNPFDYLWVYDFIKEGLDNGFHGRIYKCIYRDGHGFMVESHGKNDTIYSFFSCEGKILHEGYKKPIQEIYPELNIKIHRFFCGIYPLWEGEYSDEFVCEAANPFTMPNMKKHLYDILFHSGRSANSAVKQYIYKDENGFYRIGFGLHISHNTWGPNFIFFNCSDEILCYRGRRGPGNLCDHLFIRDLKEKKIIFEIINRH